MPPGSRTPAARRSQIVGHGGEAEDTGPALSGALARHVPRHARRLGTPQACCVRTTSTPAPTTPPAAAMGPGA